MPEILHVGPSLAPVAILIPAYNAATYLAQAIESVLRQTHRDFDLLILDDASTDNTQEVARRYLADPRVSYLRNERHQIVWRANRIFTDQSAFVRADRIEVPQRRDAPGGIRDFQIAQNHVALAIAAKVNEGIRDKHAHGVQHVGVMLAVSNN